MPFSREDKHLIKLLRQEKHYSARYFLKEFPNRYWTLGGLNHLSKKIDNCGSVERCTSSGRPCSARTVANVDKHRIRTEWAKLDHAVIAAAVRQWRRRLSACVKAGGGHFEHCF